jgi:hypothetical protein
VGVQHTKTGPNPRNPTDPKSHYVPCHYRNGHYRNGHYRNCHGINCPYAHSERKLVFIDIQYIEYLCAGRNFVFRHEVERGSKDLIIGYCEEYE